MRPLSPLAIASLLALCACSRGDDTDETGTENDVCGDIDGPDGPVPNVLGNWTADFGKNSFDENCGFSGLTAGSDYLLDGALEIDGRIPDQIWVTFDQDPTAEFWGVVSPTGALSFSGTYEHREGLMDFAFGGKAYYDEYRQRTFIEGFAWVGIDIDDNPDTYECTARGEWSASKSGL
jgi:hypothetical protein